jgi:Protein of unknown function (DUF3631)
MLRPYEVKPTKVKIDGKSVQGYRREDLHDAWTRYLPTPSATEAEPTEPAEPGQETSRSDTLSEGSGKPEPRRQVPEPGLFPEPVPEPARGPSEQGKQSAGSVGSAGSASTAEAATCCGARAPANGPLVPACKLCSSSPTFWRRHESTLSCRVCGGPLVAGAAAGGFDTHPGCEAA